MNVLMMGNLSRISKGFLAKLDDDCKCVIYNEQKNEELTGKNVVNYQREKNDDAEFLRLFSTFDFETVVFFSHALDGARKVHDELEKMEMAILACRKHRVQNFIYITTNDLLEQTPEQLEEKSRGMLITACEDLCKTFAAENRIKFLVLKVPYLYGMQNQETKLMKWIVGISKGEPIELRGTDYHTTDFLCDEDLGELVARILDEPVKASYTEMLLSGENPITLKELSELLRAQSSSANISFGNHSDCVPNHKKDTQARTEYGWFPKHVLHFDVPQMAEEYVNNTKEQTASKERRRRYRTLQDKLRIAGEMVALFVLSEVLNYYTYDNVLLNFVDFRLVFVTIMGTMNGLNAGVIAAICACVGYVVFNTAETQWQIIFYNVENWLPFACYFLLGAIPGYTRDKHDDSILYTKEEHQILEKKYIFLNELYNRVVQNKDSFNSQIIGYKDSFGKVYSVVKRLDAVLPDRVFYEAVNVLEELLENYSVAIYSTNKYSDFARLNVCSKPLNHVLRKSMKMSDYPKMIEALKEKKGFVNKECLENYPAYATPIFHNEEMQGMILLMNSTDHQMNTEFSNKFSIISDLICDALIRAMEFEQFSNNYVEGTQILQAEQFKEILSVKAHMQEKSYMDYVLLKVKRSAGDSLKFISERISGLVRNNDVIGMGEDGEVYLLLNQTKREDLDGITARMKKQDVTFEVVKG